MLTLRVLLGLFFLVSMYTSAKSLPLVFVALCQNLTPLLTAVFSYMYLRKGLTNLDIGVLLISFVGVALLITGSLEQPPQVVDPTLAPQESLVIPIISLLLFPVAGAIIAITTRNLREVHEYTVAAYIAFSMVILYTPAALLQGSSFGFIMNFNLLDWAILWGLGFSSSCLYICVQKAGQYEEPAKLASVNYFQSVFQLSFDVIFFNAVFST